jgi:hypothetical protein
MTKSQIKSAVARKRAKAQGVGGKPTNVKTFVKKSSKKVSTKRKTPVKRKTSTRRKKRK